MIKNKKIHINYLYCKKKNNRIGLLVGAFGVGKLFGE